MKTNYNSLNEQLTGKNKLSRKLGNNTYLIRNGENICIKLHETNVVTYCPDNSVIINSGGWRTNTTKERINYFSPVGLSQIKSQWFIYFNDKKYLFFDGITLNGDKINAPEYSENDQKKTNKLKTQIASFSSKMVERAINGKLGKPGNGDCFYCQMQTTDGKNLGDVSNSDHLLHHLKEKYYVPSLFWNAMNENREHFAPIDCHNLAVLQSGKNDFCMVDISKDRYVKAIKKYFYKRLNFAF